MINGYAEYKEFDLIESIVDFVKVVNTTDLGELSDEYYSEIDSAVESIFGIDNLINELVATGNKTYRYVIESLIYSVHIDLDSIDIMYHDILKLRTRDFVAARLS